MVIYEVNLSIEKKTAGALAKWLPDHVRQVLLSPGFRLARVYLQNEDTNQEKINWTVQYEIDSEQALNTYLAERAPQLREQTAQEFGDALFVSRRVVDRVQTLMPPVPETGLPMTDFPKLHCPFIRQTFKVDVMQWKKYGKQLQMREPQVYLAVNRVNPGYEWVFDDKDTIAVEKLHGTNVKVLLENGRIVALQNRKNLVDPLLVSKGQSFIMEAILQSAGKDLLPTDGAHAGEVIGPKLQGNPYKLDTHEWFPFDRSITELRYTSFDKHERTYNNLSSWFKDHLHSRLFTKRARKQGSEEKVFAEGVIFYNLRRKAEQKTWMAKLRRDMFPWYYEPVEIQQFDPTGRDDSEDQEKFD